MPPASPQPVALLPHGALAQTSSGAVATHERQDRVGLVITHTDRDVIDLVIDAGRAVADVRLSASQAVRLLIRRAARDVDQITANDFHALVGEDQRRNRAARTPR